MSAREASAVSGRTVHRLDRRGTVRDWLISPAWSRPCEDLDAVLAADGSPWGDDGRWRLTNGPDVAPLKRRLYLRAPLVADQAPVEASEGGPLEWRAPWGGTDTGTWSRRHVAPDGFVDWSAFCHTPEYRHAVAATVLEVDQPEWRTLRVASTGPVAVWVGGELLATFDDFGYMQPVEHAVPVLLPSGATTVLVATWQVAFRECRHVVRMRVDGLPLRVALLSPGADELASAVAEQVLDRVGVRSWALPDGIARLTGPPGAALRVRAGDAAPMSVRLDDDGLAAVSAERGPRAAAGDDLDSAASMLESAETTLAVQVDDNRCPPTRSLRVAALPRAHTETSAGDPPSWRQSLLEHVASGAPCPARALARWAGGHDAPLDHADLAPALEMVRRRADCADFEAVGLMLLWHRVPTTCWPTGTREEVRDTLLDFKYWIDQPGLDAMCYFTENHQLVWHTAEVLAGEAFADERFANTGWQGAEHAAHGRRLAEEWMRRKLAGGFSEFDSNAYLAIDSLALGALVDHAADPEFRALAEALLDKILLTLAANSWRGTHGAAHGRSYTPTLRSSRLEETAPIMWLLWDMGALNAAVLPATALATSRCYELPPVIRAIAQDMSPWEGRQVYRGQYRLHHDLLSRPYGSDLRVFRTAYAMLSSVQDYRSGLPGLQEHIWGATLGPEIQVFATEPANDVHDASARPNAWAGQRVLPRARQDRDTVLAVHGTGAPTHLWCPVPLLDESAQAGPWLAGRRGDGYVAVATAGGLAPVTAGDEANQAWIPRGDGAAYVATIGDRASDGSFADFVAALAPPEFTTNPSGEPHVRWTARDGRVLELGWDGPFLIDGRPADLTADGTPETPPHLDNPACRQEFGAERLIADHGGERLELDLVRGARVHPASGVTDAAIGAGYAR
jgi:hypothetical protein